MADIITRLISLNIQSLLPDIDNPLQVVRQIHYNLYNGLKSESDYSPQILICVEFYELLLKVNN